MSSLQNLPSFSNLLVAAVLGLFGSFCFLGSINGMFIFDDVEAVVNNKDIQLNTPLYKIFENDFWGTKMYHNSSHKSYRPLTVLSFRLNVWLNDGVLYPRSFHILNLILHGIATFLCYPLLWILYKSDKPTDLKPFLTTVLFAVHPIHSEAVAGIVGRADLLCAVFSFIAILIYSLGTRSINTVNTIGFTFLACICAGLAMLAKEQGITVLGVCSTYDILIVNNIHPKNILKETRVSLRYFTNKKVAKNNCDLSRYRLIIRQIVLIISGCLLMYFRWWIMGFKTPYFQKVDNPASFADDLLTRIVNYNYIYAINSWILICPEWLCFDWSMGCIPLINLNRLLEDPRILSLAFFWIVFGSIIFKMFNLPSSSLSHGF